MEPSWFSRRMLLLGTMSTAFVAPEVLAAEPVPKGTVWEQLRFIDRNHAELSLADIPTRSVLLIVWASWCATCISEIKQIEATACKANRNRMQTVLVSHPQYWSQDCAWAQRQNLRSRILTLSPYTTPDDLQLALMTDRKTFTVPRNLVYDNVKGQVTRVVNTTSDWEQTVKSL